MRLQKRIENHGYNRKSWKWACENFRSNPDPFERAVAYFVGCNQSHTARPFGSFGDPNTTAVHTNRYGTYKSQVRQILDHAERFKDVEVRNENALDLIEEMDAPTTIHYFDPPYTFRSRGRLSTKLYRYEFGELPEHLALLCQLRGLKGMAMISGRADRLYDDVLPEWRKVTYETFNALKSLPQRNGGTAPTKRDRVVEVIWMNPRMQIELFTRDVYSGKFS